MKIIQRIYNSSIVTARYRRAFVAVIALLGAVVLPLALSAYTISGRVTDKESEPMIQASVRLLSGRDSTVVKGVITDADGNFIFQNVKRGRYKVETSYVGYNTEITPVRVADADVKLPAIVLSESSIALKETTVVGIKTPITVKEDTVEFNAGTYKTAPNAVVEDLLKRLPGVEVDAQGKITANGKEVTKILVDGKEFFSDDPTVASRNLPVNMVDKLQVVDRKSDLARLTGVDDGEDETVINLTVKKGMQNGWFGNAEAGYGTDDRYKATFNVNRFWNGNQITLLGNANNVNDLGFTDGGASRFRRMGGATGVNTSQAFGVNFNVGRGEILRVGGDVMYSHSDRDTRTRSDRQYLFADSTSYYNSGKAARDRGNNVRGDFRMLWKPDSLNTLEFRPNFSYNHNDSESLDSAMTTAGDPSRSPVTRSLNRNSSAGNSFEFGGRLIYSHNFKSRPGRSFSLFADYRFSNVRERANTYSLNKFYLLNDSVDLYDQYADNHTWSNTVQARATWTEPLGDAKRGNFLTFSYRIQYRWNNADKLTYDHPVSFPDGWEGDPLIDYDTLIFSEDLSNSFRNDYMNQNIRLGYKHVSRTGSIDVGASLVPQMSRSEDLINAARNIPTRWVWNYAPYLRYRYKMGKSRSFNFDYRGRSSQPTMAQLQPVADKSDPLHIVIGNPELDPSFTHNIRLRFQDFNAEQQRSIMAMAFANVTQNSIISRTAFDPQTGGQVTTYENVNGVWNVSAMTMISMPLRNKAFTFNNHLALSYSRTVGYNNDVRNASGTFGLMEFFSFAWRPTDIELELRPTYRLQTTSNTAQTSADRTVHTYGGSFNATYYTPVGIVLNSELVYNATSGYSDGYDVNQWLWNASISYQFLRGRNATISLKAYDLLRQQTNVNRTVTANYIEDQITNSLGRYFMITFAYKFTTFAAGEQPRDRNEDYRYRGRPGPPPGAPAGHPRF